MSLSWGNVSVSKVKFNILSINSGKTIVKLYWSAFFRIDKVGNVPKKVLKHCCQLGGIKKIWGRMVWSGFVEASYLRQRRAHLVGTVHDRRQNSQAQFLLRKHSSQALQEKSSSPDILSVLIQHLIFKPWHGMVRLWALRRCVDIKYSARTDLACKWFISSANSFYLVAQDKQLDFDLVLVAQDEGRKCNMGQACRHSLQTF